MLLSTNILLIDNLGGISIDYSILSFFKRNAEYLVFLSLFYRIDVKMQDLKVKINSNQYNNLIYLSLKLISIRQYYY